ncbi:diguanylate cyclase (GGDEF) domain-containing protein [Faunimonas pinastri]|uniref:diguanylate cyclase n=1 Tax=Faunimonas pinastri TaxID=1855383 RepID=A0A1H9D5N8_9HYPH|nr:GGDEF domain-containing protein [Faunimonas pinastri]SEQ08802.1 diguanylate cyclase (GGDEF) domain-containing protein [Faunimonas pinastri]
MDLYGLMQRLSWPRGYSGRIFLICFIGTHIPLLALVIFTLVSGGWHDPVARWAFLVTLLGTVAGAIATIFAIQQMLYPLHRSSRALEEYVAGRPPMELPTQYHDEGGRLMANVQRTLLRLNQAMEELNRQAMMDPLTEIGNRRFFDMQFDRVFRDSAKGGTDLSLVILDVDHFKAINDLHGHLTGDSALVQLAELLKRDVRAGDQVARVGGDEFCMLLPGADLDDAEEIARRVERSVAAVTVPGLEPGALRVSYGLAARREEDVRVEDIYSRADRALYAAKRHHRDRVADDGLSIARDS